MLSTPVITANSPRYAPPSSIYPIPFRTAPPSTPTTVPRPSDPTTRNRHFIHPPLPANSCERPQTAAALRIPRSAPSATRAARPQVRISPCAPTEGAQSVPHASTRGNDRRGRKTMATTLAILFQQVGREAPNSLQYGCRSLQADSYVSRYSATRVWLIDRLWWVTSTVMMMVMMMIH